MKHVQTNDLFRVYIDKYFVIIFMFYNYIQDLRKKIKCYNMQNKHFLNDGLINHRYSNLKNGKSQIG